MSAEAAPPVRAIRSRWPVVAWGLWDWGGSAFNAVVTTFVFTVYLTTDGLFGSPNEVAAALGWTLAGAGVVVALVAPISGQRADAGGGRRRWLGIHTGVVVACVLLMFLVRPEPSYLWLGLGLLAVGTVFFEFASVNYNAMLTQVSTRATIGRVSGFGWGMGYVGGIVLLLIVYLGFISPEVGLFGVTGDDGLDVRVSILIAGIWFAVFALPVLFAVPSPPSSASAVPARTGVLESYRILFRRIGRLWRESRTTVAFLIASAVFRDGLTGVFTFGGVLAQGTFGFSAGDVILFAIAANVVAGVATISVGALDDRLGPKTVIVASLIGLVVCGTAVFVLHDGGATVFWIFGLLLCLFVGPAQSASRTYLARLIPPGSEGEVFGLYATTGRAASFIAPAAFAAFVSLAAVVTGGEENVQHWGILGLVLVLGVGLLLLLPVQTPAAAAAPAASDQVASQ